MKLVLTKDDGTVVAEWDPSEWSTPSGAIVGAIASAEIEDELAKIARWDRMWDKWRDKDDG